MAIVTIKEVASVGDKFYLPGQYEIPDQALLYNRKAALIDFMASSLVTSTPSGSKITGLMQVELEKGSLKRNDTVVLVKGLTPTVDILGRVVFDEPLYTLVSVSEWKTDTLTPTLVFKSTHDITPPEGWESSLKDDTCTVQLKAGHNDVPVIIDGDQVDTIPVDVKTLEVGVEGVSKDKMYIYPKLNGEFVKGLTLSAPDCTFKENTVSYTMTYVGEPQEVVARTVTVEDPRPWPKTNVEFSFPAVADFELSGLPETVKADSTTQLTVTPTPTDAIGNPTWSVVGKGATITPNGRQATLTLKGAEGPITVKVDWGVVSKEGTATIALESLTISKDSTAGLQDIYVKSSGTNDNPMFIRVEPDANLPASATSSTTGVTIGSIKYDSANRYTMQVIADSTTPIGKDAVSIDVTIGGFKETLKYTTIKRTS